MIKLFIIKFIAFLLKKFLKIKRLETNKYIYNKKEKKKK